MEQHNKMNDPGCCDEKDFFSLFEAMLSFFFDWDIDELDKNVTTPG